MEKNKITPHQLFTLSAVSSLGGSILVVAAAIVSAAKRDAWISGIISLASGMIIVWLYCYLGTRYRDKTFIGALKSIFGKYLGSVLGFLYISIPITLSYHIPWYMGTFGKQVLRETPMYVISSVFIVAVVVSVLYGIEAIARASEILIKLCTVLFTLTIILVLPNAKIENILPVMENGIIPVLRGSFILVNFPVLSIFFMLMTFPVGITDISGGKKSLYKAHLWSGFIVFISILSTLLVLGSDITERSTIVTILLAREIKIGLVLTRLEYIVTIIWTVSQFFACVVFFYVSILGLSELLGLKDYRKIVAPFGLVMLILSGVVFPDSVYRANWVNVVYLPYMTTIGFLLPLLTLVVYIVKKYVLGKE